MDHFFDLLFKTLRKLGFLSTLFLVSNFVNAQLSDLHYLPPLKQGQNNAGIRDQAIYLSTPEPTTFAVNAYQGTNPTPVATFNISNLTPAEWTLSDGDNNIILVNNANTGVVLSNSGLRFESPSGNRFYVNYRGNSSAQAASLTAKGRQALGTRFKWGGVPNLGAHPSKSNTLGIMATEDNTTVELFGYDPDCEFRVGNDRAGITANTYTVTLDANESFVFETYIGNSPTQAHEDGWIGATIESDKDIVISNGSINFGRQAGASNRDAGIDQPVPENRLGKEYVFIRGNGGTNGLTEFPLIIATADNTQIFVNGGTTPIATINNGDYFQVPSTYYSSNTVGANMLLQTSKDAYAYQCMAGASQVYTQGLNFVAPVNCLLPDVMDNIPDIRNMAGTTVTGGMTIIAAVNTPDANIQVTDGNGAVTLPASNPVAGSSDWKTFYIPNLNGNVSVVSTGPMAVGFFGFNGARGVAGYFSGFDTLPEVTLEIRGGSGCFVGSEIFEATNNNFDAFQ
ncbi:MAG: IgGFc-binding protein, partial [Bacteroidota bacterium]